MFIQVHPNQKVDIFVNVRLSGEKICRKECKNQSVKEIKGNLSKERNRKKIFTRGSYPTCQGTFLLSFKTVKGEKYEIAKCPASTIFGSSWKNFNTMSRPPPPPPKKNNIWEQQVFVMNDIRGLY